MKRSVLSLAVAAILGLSAPRLHAQGSAVVEPFKLGTFQTGAKPFVGIVLRRQHHHRRGRRQRGTAPQSPPAVGVDSGDMLGVISAYEYGVQRRLYDIITRR